MVRLTGYVNIAGRREYLTRQIDGSRIFEGAGLPSEEIPVNAAAPAASPAPATPETPELAPAEPTSYEDMNKTELQVLCSQRGLSTAGLKADLIARLTESDEAEPATEGETDGGESDSE